MKPFQIGIDLGGTKTEAILISPDGEIAYRQRIATPKSDSGNYSAICNAIYDLIRETEKQAAQTAPVTIGIGIPGIIDTATQTVINANTTCLIGRPFKSDLEQRLGRKIGVENDANCFVLAESRKGAAKGAGMVFGIIMGTGCGGGICQNGEIYNGHHGIAGEWGHFIVDPAGELCYCGNRGCIETKISGGGMARAFYRKYNRHLDMGGIVTGYRMGDKEAVEAFECFLDDFGRSLGGIISVLDPDLVVIGGGLSNIDELYTKGYEKVKQYAFTPRLKTPILKNKLGDSAGVFGAAWIGV